MPAAKGKAKPDDDRRAIHAYLSPGAHDAWHEFAIEQGISGISVSALLEALSQVLPQVFDPTQQPHVNVLRETLAEVVKTARRIDGDRRRRGTNR